jgi:hypothetical protein
MGHRIAVFLSTPSTWAASARTRRKRRARRNRARASRESRAGTVALVIDPVGSRSLRRAMGDLTVAGHARRWPTACSFAGWESSPSDPDRSGSIAVTRNGATAQGRLFLV